MEILRGIKENTTFYDVKEILLNFPILDNDIMGTQEAPGTF
jgi:hypothetical protein